MRQGPDVVLLECLNSSRNEGSSPPFPPLAIAHIIRSSLLYSSCYFYDDVHGETFNSSSMPNLHIKNTHRLLFALCFFFFLFIKLFSNAQQFFTKRRKFINTVPAVHVVFVTLFHDICVYRTKELNLEILIVGKRMQVKCEKLYSFRQNDIVVWSCQMKHVAQNCQYWLFSAVNVNHFFSQHPALIIVYCINLLSIKCV